MESKGLFKAMGELDMLFNYIETYLASKRNRNPGASVWRPAESNPIKTFMAGKKKTV